MRQRDGDDHDACSALAGLVDDELIEAYAVLLRRERWREHEVLDRLDSQLMHRLIDEGMASWQSRPDDEPWLMITPPTLALMAQLVLLGKRTVAAQERLLTGQQRLAEMQWARYEGAAAGDLVEIVTDRAAIHQLSSSLVVTAREHWMSLDNTLARAPLTELQVLPPPVAPGVEVRAIYDRRCLETPVGMEMVRLAVEQGEVARSVPHVPMKMKLADETAALLPLDPTGVGGAMVLRAPVILHALRDYFELLWATGTPLGEQTPVPELNEAQTAVLRLLVEDVNSDEAISRRLGVSVPTVRRHINAIRKVLGVEGRCALGAAAVRRGWIR